MGRRTLAPRAGGSKAFGAAEPTASKKTVTPGNLAALGADRLAAILVDLADGDAEIKRRLSLELAAEESGDNIAAEIGKRVPR